MRYKLEDLIAVLPDVIDRARAAEFPEGAVMRRCFGRAAGITFSLQPIFFVLWRL